MPQSAKCSHCCSSLDGTGTDFPGKVKNTRCWKHLCLINILDGGAEKTQRRREIGEFVRTLFVLDNKETAETRSRALVSWLNSER
uniref:Uncharacterized protein n=1 Tax=Anguilla anguilla TaxID=7936 RepID=A0A0E9ST73_ANGAN